MSRFIGIAGVQMDVSYGVDNSANVLRLLNIVAATYPWVDIVLFSELCTCGENLALAEPIPNPTTKRLSEWAKKGLCL